MKTNIALGATAAIFLSLACGRSPDAPAPTTTTGARTLSSEDAITRVASARCEREVSCNNIGADGKYQDRDACMREVRQNTKSELRSDECPRGINGERLEQCLTEIRNEGCGNPIDTIDRMASCRRSELCIGD
jgi:hypothetical protein